MVAILVGLLLALVMSSSKDVAGKKSNFIGKNGVLFELVLLRPKMEMELVK